MHNPARYYLERITWAEEQGKVGGARHASAANATPPLSQEQTIWHHVLSYCLPGRRTIGKADAKLPSNGLCVDAEQRNWTACRSPNFNLITYVVKLSLAHSSLIGAKPAHIYKRDSVQAR